MTRSLIPDDFDPVHSDVLTERRLVASTYVDDAKRTQVRIVLSEDQNGGSSHGALQLDLHGVRCEGLMEDGVSIGLSPAVARALLQLLQEVGAMAVYRGILPVEDPVWPAV